MKIDGITIERLNHDCFKIKKDRVVYFDPFRISENERADIILVTHEHFDHLSTDDIRKLADRNTTVVSARQSEPGLAGIKAGVKEVVIMPPNRQVVIGNIQVEAVPAYNTNKFKSPGVPFHSKGDGKLGFVITIGGKRIYHAGDTDLIPEMSSLKNIDIALLPVSGTYVMTAEEAAEAASVINPRIAIPMHYGSIVGSANDAERFKKLAGCEVIIL